MMPAISRFITMVQRVLLGIIGQHEASWILLVMWLRGRGRARARARAHTRTHARTHTQDPDVASLVFIVICGGV
jgi:hypothetical protein